MTRQELLTRVRQMSDTLNATVDYPDDLLSDLATVVHASEWRTLLGAAPYYRTNTITVALDSDRRFPVSDLTTGTGNDVKYMHRVLELTDNAGANLTFAQADRLRLVNFTSTTTEKLWTRKGDVVQCFGVSPGETMHVLVNYVPTPVGDLDTDDAVVDWPEQWRTILFYEIAALALSKAGRETNEARELMQFADRHRQMMLAALSRDAAQPYILGADDHPWEWGG